MASSNGQHEAAARIEEHDEGHRRLPFPERMPSLRRERRQREREVLPHEKVCRVFVISPSDALDERQAVREVVSQWNASIGSVMGVHVEAVGWETHVRPSSLGHPQDLINKKVDTCHMGVAVFNARLGTPTRSALSGSVEEITRLLGHEREVLIYHREMAETDRDQYDPEQVRALRAYLDDMRQKALLGSFSSVHDLKMKLLGDLTQCVKEFLDQACDAETTRAEQVVSADRHFFRRSSRAG